jgi:ABC-type cobalamin transport system permease subunit
MNHTLFPFRNLAPLVIAVLGMVLGTAAQAAARQPAPGRGEPTGTYPGPSTASVHHVTQSPVSAPSWLLLAAAVLAAVVLGAALMHLAQRRRVQLAR